MSKLVPCFSGVACCVWIAAWAWYLSPEENQAEQQPRTVPSLFSLSLDDVILDSLHAISFPLSDAVPVAPPEFQRMAKEVGIYLGRHPSRLLTITGVFSPHERNQTSYPNLGSARAEAVKMMFSNSGIPNDRLKVASMEAQNLVEVNGQLPCGVLFTFAEAPVPLAEKKEPASAAKAGGPQDATTFRYAAGAYRLDKKNHALLDKLGKLLRADPAARLNLTGYSAQGEEEASKYNLAEIRALMVRRYLVDRGVRRNQIEVFAKPSMATGLSEQVVLLQLD